MTRSSLLALVAVVTVAACSHDAKPPADSGLSQDLALANQVQPQTQPILQDTALTPKPVEKPRAPQRVAQTPAPRPAPPPPPPPPAPVVAPPPPTPPAPQRPAPEPVVTAPSNGGGGSGMGGAGNAPTAKEVGVGSALSVATGARVCTSTNRPGDKIVASLSSPVSGSNGAVIPAGSTVVLEVASMNPGDTPNNATMTFRLRSVVVNNTSYPVTGDVTILGPLEQVKVAANTGSDTKKVVGGAIAGALIGRILGGSTKGAVIGAAGGAATGAVVAKAGEKKYDACLAEGTPMKVVLGDKITLGS